MKLPRFTLRDLFWLVLVAAMGCGWWVTWKTWQSRNEQLAQSNKQLIERLRDRDRHAAAIQTTLDYAMEAMRVIAKERAEEAKFPD